MTLPDPQPDWAWFLDIDGTLIEFVENPAAEIGMPDSVLGILQDLHFVSDGALALVSGRSAERIRQMAAPLALPHAGLHGMEICDGIRPQSRAPGIADMPAGARQSLMEFAKAVPGCFFEDKGVTIGIHFRGAPHALNEARRAAELALSMAGSGYELLPGNMLFELRPKGFNKGSAVRHFMALPNFAGRVPVFIGDDVTDEDGFATVNEMGGFSIRVGNGDHPTLAQYEVKTVGAFLLWLSTAVAAIAD